MDYAFYGFWSVSFNRKGSIITTTKRKIKRRRKRRFGQLDSLSFSP
jgi:hypothetical protein